MGEGEWAPIDTVPLKNLVPGVYKVRVLATTTAFQSEEATVTIAPFAAAKEPTPSAAIDYSTEELTGLANNADYELYVGITATSDASGKISLLGLIPASTADARTLSIVKKGNGTTTIDSDPFDALPPRQLQWLEKEPVSLLPPVLPRLCAL